METKEKKWTASEMGKKGGKTKGVKKLRGDSAYYSQLAKKRGKGAKSTVKKQTRGL